MLFITPAARRNHPAIDWLQNVQHRLSTTQRVGQLRGFRRPKPLTVHAGKYKVRCNYLVIATHTPLMGKTSLLSATLFQSKLALYTSYVLGATVPQGLVPEGLFWDTGDPYYYLRVDRHAGQFAAHCLEQLPLMEVGQLLQHDGVGDQHFQHAASQAVDTRLVWR